MLYCGGNMIVNGVKQARRIAGATDLWLRITNLDKRVRHGLKLLYLSYMINLYQLLRTYK